MTIFVPSGTSQLMYQLKLMTEVLDLTITQQTKILASL